MKRFIRNTYLCAALLAVVCTSCDNDTDTLFDEPNNAATELPDGYFRATFFPQPSNENASRAAINGNSEQIQSLICLIYRKQEDGTYTYVDEKNVINYEGNEGNITPQTYEWPLKQEVSFDLPSGDYKAVFVGNVQKTLFAEQKGNEILTDYKSSFTSARINMPEKGPQGFNDYNMFYLATVDFSPANPSPYVILQRLVANNVYTRTAIDDNQAVTMLVDNIVADIRSNELTTEIVREALRSKILAALRPIEALTEILTPVVDRLVNMLLGDVLEFLNETLLHEVEKRLEASLKGDGGTDNSLAGLNYLLNPWTAVDNVDITFSSLPRSIDFNRECRSYFGETVYNDFPLSDPKKMENGGIGDYTNVRHVSVKTLCGNHKLKSITVNSDLLLASLVSKVDEKVINSLLVNINVPLGYTMQSNLQYGTPYELVNLTLSDFKTESTDRIAVDVKLNEIVNLEELVKQLLGENIISGLVGGLTNGLVQPLVKALDEVVLGDILDIALPVLGIDNIVAEGGWDATHVSDGTIAASTNK